GPSRRREGQSSADGTIGTDGREQGLWGRVLLAGSSAAGAGNRRVAAAGPAPAGPAAQRGRGEREAGSRGGRRAPCGRGGPPGRVPGTRAAGAAAAGRRARSSV